MTKIEYFIEQKYGIKLLPGQLEVIAAITKNLDHNIGLNLYRLKKSGYTTAKYAAMAYLQDGLKQVDKPVIKIEVK